MNNTIYLTALENFINRLQHLPDADPERISETMTELCEVLRLGKVEVIMYENEAAEHLGAYMSSCFYDCGKADENIGISKRISAIDEKIAIYNIYSKDGEAEWTEEEQNRINTFITVLSTFREKFRLVKFAHEVTFYDSDFGMYNLKQFMKYANILSKTGRINQFTAVRFNFKRFSAVNQYIGRKNGTIVMKKFIGMIDNILDNENELICRIGGDNFIILVKSVNLQPLLDILGGVGIVYDEERGERIFVPVTVGVYDIKDTDGVLLPTDIMDRVSIAAQIAKNSPNTDIVYFDDTLLERSKHRNEISANFQKALDNREFLVYYQPKVAVEDGHIAGAEALCRWIHDGQMISPGEFIPVLEQGHDICKLDFYMLDTVCKDIRRWIDSGMNAVRVSVNLSRRHLSDIDLLDRIIEIVDRNNVPHEYIEIELTETTTDVEFKDLKRIIGGLQQAGIFTSVDDFGIGYSSLNLIKEIPWDVLKLDRSLLPTERDDNPAQKSIMFKYIVAMAQEMGLECISEGVETKEQLQLLVDNKCDLAQGFYFDKPLPVEEFELRLNQKIYS